MVEALVRLAVFAHIRPMANRPCKPDADLKRLGRTLLSGTPFPVCGAPENSDPAADESAGPVKDSPDDAEPNGKCRTG
jgi:hypothetical protein